MDIKRGTAGCSHFSHARPVPTDSRYRYGKRIYRALFRVLDTVATPLVALGRVLISQPDERDPSSILVVQLDHIGDAVLTTPMLRALHERFPDAAIDVLASHSNREIFQGNPHVRDVIVSERNWHARGGGKRSTIGEVLRLARHLRPLDYDLGIDPRGDFLVVLMLWLAGIRRRLGWACGGGGFLLTDVAGWDATRHEGESRRALLELLEIRGIRFDPEVFPSWADSYSVREALAALPGLRSPLAVVHVSAGTKAKRWPESHFGELVHRLLRELVGTVIVVGESADAPRGRQLARATGNVIDWTGRLTLMQLAALLDESDLFVGADSGPAHVAAACGVPSVVLFSGTNRSDCWRPIGSRVHVVRSPTPCSPCHLNACPVSGHPCMSNILPWEVVEAARQIMPQSHRRRLFLQRPMFVVPPVGGNCRTG